MVRTRFSPSPTGDLHIGGVRTALYSWLYAKNRGGQFLLRIEDTDQQRSTEQATQMIIQGLEWLGMDYLDEPIFQSQRQERYQQLIGQLVEQDKAYYCDCSVERLTALREQQREQGIKPQYDRHCRHLNLPQKPDTVVRLKTPLEGRIGFVDAVYGELTVDNHQLDDLVIARANGIPTYNFAVVVDDMDSNITDVIRGDDHINNTFRQLHVYEALQGKIPQFAHCPMVLGSDGAKLSKRHGALGVLGYRDLGILPQALLNYLLRLGWSAGDKEIFTQDEMIELFNLEHIHRSAPHFDNEKLYWVNQQHLKSITYNQLQAELDYHLKHQKITVAVDAEQLTKILALCQERTNNVSELVTEIQPLVQSNIELDQTLVDKHIIPNKLFMEQLYQQLQQLQQWQRDDIMQKIKHIATENQVKLFNIAMPFRVLLTGRDKSADISKIAELLGQHKTLQRLTLKNLQNLG